ncbi:hypothetical protein [Enterococcus alishanensis]
MPKIFSNYFTTQKLVRIKYLAKKWTLLCIIFFVLYRFVFYDLFVMTGIQEFFDWIAANPIQNIVTLFVVYLLIKFISKIWWVGL